jgi:hypothetical protein
VVNVVGLPDGTGMCIETCTDRGTAIEILASDGHVIRIAVRPDGDVVVATDGLDRSGHVVTVDGDGFAAPEPAVAR